LVRCLGYLWRIQISLKWEKREKGEEEEKKVFVYQNSWGLSTRTIGAMVMIHGDDKGLVLPPRVAKIQVIIVPVGLSKNLEKNKGIYEKCEELENELREVGVRVKADLREGYTPGWKFNEWKLKVSSQSHLLISPILIEI
jgi:prolyl-tRNA synthetase